MDLSIIIVSWNVRDLLSACLDSLAAQVPSPPAGRGYRGGVNTEVIVLDSASTDGSADRVRDRYPWVRLIAEPENVGFTRGNNIALQTAHGRHVMLLNPDTVIHKNALNQLVAYLDAHLDVGIVGPQVLNADGSTQSTRRRFPTKLTAFFESTWLQGYAPRRILDRFYVTDQPDDGTFDVDWVQGCALVARREVYDQIGPLDEGYVMYSEEMDWCTRAKRAGWRVVYVGDARITHYGGKSTEQVEGHKHLYFQQSKLRYFRKFHGRGFALALWVFLLLSYGAQIAQEGAKALLGSKRAMRRARITTYWRVIGALARGHQTVGH
ncbi:MAG: glycosyltransferase family 2 protein [Anaerolineae bacterium]|nr:glycosyltransferase family 2 protein [Anaerolineae bacterium]